MKKIMKDDVKKDDSSDANLNKKFAILSYMWILCLIPLLYKRNSKFCQFHAKQGLILFVFSFVSWFPVFGWILCLALILVSIMGVKKTYDEEYWEIPYIYNWSKKIKL